MRADSSILNLSDGRIDLLPVLVVADADRRQSVASAELQGKGKVSLFHCPSKSTGHSPLTTSHSDNVSVDSARHAVDELDVQLGQSVFCREQFSRHIQSITLAARDDAPL